MRTRKKLKGFTLVELIVVVAVFGILLAASLNLIVPLKRVFHSTSQYSNSSAVVDNVRMVIEDNLRFANRMYVHYGVETADIDTFINNEVDRMRDEFLLKPGSGRVSYASDTVYAMRIHNPKASTGFSNIDATAEKPGKISIYKYENGTRTADSKEWALSEGLYDEYAFSLSFGIKEDSWDTTEKTVGGTMRYPINKVEYEDVNFISPSNFTLSLDIFEKDFVNPGDKRNSNYTLCRTYVNNTVTLSLVNVTSSNVLADEQIYVNGSSGIELSSSTPTRYQYIPHTPADPDNASADIIIIYTVPDLT